MLLALALYASTAHETTPHYDVDLLYHDGKAHRLDKHFRIWLTPSPPRCTLAWHRREREPEAGEPSSAEAWSRK